MISEDRLQKALTYLAETDQEFGRLKGRLEGLDYRLKITEAVGITEGQGKGNVDLIKSLARTSQDYIQIASEIEDTAISFHTLAAKRATEATIVDVFRTLEASKRSGNIR